MASFLLPISWGGRSLQTADYRAAFDKDSRVQDSPQAASIETERIDNYPVHARFQQLGKNFSLRIIVKDPDRAKRETLQSWFDPRRGRQYLVAVPEEEAHDDNARRILLQPEDLIWLDVNSCRVMLRAAGALWQSESVQLHEEPITTSGQTFSVTTPGTTKTWPRFTITPQAAKSNLTSWAKMHRVFVANRSTKTVGDPVSGYPIEISGGAFSGPGDDVRVIIYSEEQNRWIEGDDVWANLHLRSGKFATLAADIDDVATELTVDNLEGLGPWPEESGFFFLDDEVIHYSARTPFAMAELVRGFHSTAAAHSAGAQLIWIQHPFLYFIFDNSVAGSPPEPLNRKPVLVLAESSNTKHVIDGVYFNDADLRSRAFQRIFTDDGPGATFIRSYQEDSQAVFENEHPHVGKPGLNNGVLMTPCGLNTDSEPLTVEVEAEGVVPVEGPGTLISGSSTSRIETLDGGTITRTTNTERFVPRRLPTGSSSTDFGNSDQSSSSSSTPAVGLIGNQPLNVNLYLTDLDGYESRLEEDALSLPVPLFALAEEAGAGQLYQSGAAGVWVAVGDPFGVHPFDLCSPEDGSFLAAIERDETGHGGHGHGHGGHEGTIYIWDGSVWTAKDTPAAPDRLYCFPDGELWLWASGTLYSSTDQGDTWDDSIDPAAGLAEDLAVDIAANDDVAAVAWLDTAIGTADTHPLMVSLSEDRGATWVSFTVTTPPGGAPSTPAIMPKLNPSAGAGLLGNPIDVFWVENSESIKSRGVRKVVPTLDVPLEAGATEAYVGYNDTDGWPASGTFTIDLEEIAYASKTLTAFLGLTRGQSGTSDVFHPADAELIGGPHYVQDSILTHYTSSLPDRLSHLLWSDTLVFARSKPGEADIGVAFNVWQGTGTAWNRNTIRSDITAVYPTAGPASVLANLVLPADGEAYAFTVFENEDGTFKFWIIDTSELTVFGDSLVLPGFIPGSGFTNPSTHSPTFIQDPSFPATAYEIIVAPEAVAGLGSRSYEFGVDAFSLRVNVEIPVGDDLEGERLSYLPDGAAANGALVRFGRFVLPYNPALCPKVYVAPEEPLYLLNGRLVNNTTGDYMDLFHPLAVGESLVVETDPDFRGIVDGETGEHVPWVRSGGWPAHEVGENEFEWIEPDVSDVDLAIEWRDNYL